MTQPILLICCVCTACPKAGSHRRPPVICASSCATAPNSSTCTSLRQQIHALLAANGIAIPVSDLFGVAGNQLLDRAALSPAARTRVSSLRHLLDALDVEIDSFTKLTKKRSHGDARYQAVQTIPGIGDITRFPDPQWLASWAGLTRSITSPATTVHRGRITKQGRAVSWSAGPRSRRRNAPARTPGPGNAAIRSEHVAAANIGVTAAAP